MSERRIVYKDTMNEEPEVREITEPEFREIPGTEVSEIPEPEFLRDEEPEPETSVPAGEPVWSEEDYELRANERRSQLRAKQTRKKRLTVLAMIVLFAFLVTMCGKDIIRLKAENRSLKKQQEALQKERDELKAELENTTEQEYIRDQARKQLRLLNPGELLFIFDDE